MPDRHDDVDAWLTERIDPLPPPPGTFELIKRRARRRKYRRLAVAATGAAVIVAAAVTVPQVVSLPVVNAGRPAARVVAGPSASVKRTGSGAAASAAASAVPSAIRTMRAWISPSTSRISLVSPIPPWT